MDILEHAAALVRGDFLTDSDARRRASVDGSIFEVMPAAVFAPRDAGDIQAVLHLLWTHAKRGKKVPSLTVRGAGTDQAGGPLGDGIILDTRRHLNQILEVGDDTVRVEPGVRYADVQTALKARGRYLPPYPASVEFATIGGAVANNASGEKTVKYGDTRDYIQSLKVVLANGDLVELRALDKAELASKKHTYSFEGQVYRDVLRILAAHEREHELPRFHVSKNATGYAVWAVEQRGVVNLAKLFCGSQGTLGVITEITLRTEPLPAATSLLAGFFAGLDQMADAVEQLLALEPSALEIVDHNLITLVEQRDPSHLKGIVPTELPRVVLIVEFDDANQAKKVKAAESILKHYTSSYRIAHDETEQANLWRLRRSAAAMLWTVPGNEKPLPIIEDGVVPTVLLPEFFRRAYGLFERYGVRVAIWGHAGDANLHIQPFMDLSRAADREKLWPFIDEFHKIVIEMGGCISAEHNDGLLRSPYLKQQYGEEMYTIFEQVKRAFDPYNYLNPGKKVGVSLDAIKPLLRSHYSLDHIVTNHQDLNR